MKLAFALLSSLFLGSPLLLGAPNTYVDQAVDFTITIDQGASGLSAGDTVTWTGVGTAVPNLIFGTTAFTLVQDAVNATDLNGTVHIAAGTFDDGQQITVSQSLSIRGQGSGVTALTGNSDGDALVEAGEHRVLLIDGAGTSLQVYDLSIIDGMTVDSGGGVVNNGVFSLNDSVITRCRGNFGGGIDNNLTLFINNSTISDCYALTDGGAIYSSGAGVAVTIEGSTISGNDAVQQGGGGVTTAGNFTARDTVFSGNIINNHEGGAIYASPSAVITLERCRFSQNKAAYGGAIFMDSHSSLTAIECQFDSNNATQHGGALYCGYNTDVNATDTLFKSNSASSYGGAIFNADDNSYGTDFGARTTLLRCVLQSNRGSTGGAIYNGGGATNMPSLPTPTTRDVGGYVAAIECFFNGNYTTSGGGGGVFNCGTLLIQRSTFTANNCSWDGAALYNYEMEYSNTSGGSFLFPAKASVYNSTFSGNGSSYVRYGGGLYNKGDLEIVGCTLTKNQARGSGGVHTVSGIAVTTIYNSILAGNSANFDPDATTNFTGFNPNVGNIIGLPANTLISDIIDTTLRDNGGPTLTHALVTGSPAIDNGVNAQIPSGVTTDQRGALRTYNSVTDSGAYEVAPRVSYTSVNPPNDTIGLSQGDSITLTFSGNIIRNPLYSDLFFYLRSVDGGLDIPFTWTIVNNQFRVTLGSLANIPSGTAFTFGFTGYAFHSAVYGTPVRGVNFGSAPTYYTGFPATYVDQAADFSPASPSVGTTVAWKPGTADEVTGLVYGFSAFSSINDAVTGTSKGGTIHIAAGTYLEGSKVMIQKSLTIQGDGPGQTIIDGASSHRVFEVSTTQARMDGMTIQNANGSGVANGSGATLYLSNILFDGNQGDSGGGLFNSYSSLYGVNLTFINNSATGYGGGFASTFGGTVELANATFHANTAEMGGGGISQMDGGVYATMTIMNSTLSGNSVTSGSGTGGGIYQNTSKKNSRLDLWNSLVIGNSASSNAEVSGTFFPLNSTTSLAGQPVSAFIEPLADNGGSLPTFLPASGSPALNTGSNALLPIDRFDLDGDGNTSESLSRDPRGSVRISGTAVDQGAVELRFYSAPQLSWTDTQGSKSVTNPNQTASVNFDGSTQAAQSLTLENLATVETLQLFSATLTGPDADLFTVSGYTSGTLAPSASGILTVTYTGPADSMAYAQLHLATDYLASGGRGTPGETFTLDLVMPNASGAINYSSWIAGYALGGVDGFLEDADGDNNCNGLEALLGTDPTASSGALIPLSLSGGVFSFRHAINATSLGDVVGSYTWSEDLITFHADGASNGNGSTVTFAPGPPSGGMVVVNTNVTGPPLHRLFVRLTAQQASPSH